MDTFTRACSRPLLSPSFMHKHSSMGQLSAAQHKPMHFMPALQRPLSTQGPLLRDRRGVHPWPRRAQERSPPLGQRGVRPWARPGPGEESAPGPDGPRRGVCPWASPVPGEESTPGPVWGKERSQPLGQREGEVRPLGQSGARRGVAVHPAQCMGKGGQGLWMGCPSSCIHIHSCIHMFEGSRQNLPSASMKMLK